MHKEAEKAEAPPVLYEETRRRTFAGFFSDVMLLATFHGRPPSLSRRYVTTRPPMDVCEADLMADDATQMVTQFGPNGWDASGEIHQATLIRASMAIAFLRDEMLELSLGVPSADMSQHIRYASSSRSTMPSSRTNNSLHTQVGPSAHA